MSDETSDEQAINANDNRTTERDFIPKEFSPERFKIRTFEVKCSKLNTELFIARKIIKGKQNANRITKPIVIISLISIVLGIAFMIVAVAVVTGFQKGIREKVIGFGAHIQVTDFDDNSS